MPEDIDDKKSSAPTAALTSLTHTAPGSDDFAIQNFVDAVTGAFAFKTADEANSVLKTIRINQTRINEIVTALQRAGVMA